MPRFHLTDQRAILEDEMSTVPTPPTVFSDSDGTVRGEVYGASASTVGNDRPAH